ncbi:MAG TPA: SCO family protein [Candidatus Dormibacteraeota bacterium]|nr:SCO family protein [Candidatus Dormibacteraeota bacterium]
MGILSKPLTWLGLSAAAAVVMFGLAAWVLSTPRVAPPTGASANGSGLAADIVIPAKSMAAPDFTLTDQNGKPLTLSSLRGRVLAITFLDSHCKQLCPLEGDQLAQTQRALGSKSGWSLLVVSVAPATDSPDSERVFASAHHWTGDWHWLNGSADQLATIWKAYSIAVQDSADNVLHTTVLYLVDRDGYERAGWAAGIQSDRLAHDVRLLNGGA